MLSSRADDWQRKLCMETSQLGTGFVDLVNKKKSIPCWYQCKKIEKDQSQARFPGVRNYETSWYHIKPSHGQIKPDWEWRNQSTGLDFRPWKSPSTPNINWVKSNQPFSSLWKADLFTPIPTPINPLKDP